MIGVNRQSTNGRTTLWTTASALALLTTAAPAMAQQAAETPSSPTPAPTEDPQEAEIVVTGIRASLNRGAEIKRQSAQVVDAISSEELGKLPDQNIAEGLQRITGVQIQRSGGEGNRFQIRGSNQNLTLINGREVAPDGDFGTSAPIPTRQVNLFNYPSELFSQVLVYKSPAASQIEGGIGGTVDLRTPEPLKAPERTIVAGDVGYFSLAKTTGYRLAAITSQRFLDDTIGVVLGATYFSRNTATDSYGGSSFFTTNAVDVTGDGVGDPNVALPFNMTYIRQFNDRKRLTLNGVVEWRPSDAFRAYVDVAYIDQKTNFDRAFVAFNLNTARALAVPTAATTQPASNGSTSFVAGELRNVLLTQDGLAQTEGRKLYQGAIGAAWDIGPRLKFSAELAGSKSKADARLVVFQVKQPSISAAIDLRPELPTARVTAGGALNDPAAYESFVLTVARRANEPDVVQARADLNYEFDQSFLSKLSTGIRYTRQQFTNELFQNRFQDTFPIGRNPRLSSFPQYITTFNESNFFGGRTAPNNFVVPTVTPSDATQTKILADFGDTRPLQPQPVTNYVITERTKAGYVQLDFAAPVGDMSFSGNVGIRYVETEQNSASATVTSTGQTVPIAIDNNYSDLLPSLNLKLEISRNFLVRASASKVMSRPDLQSLNAGTNIQFASGLNQAQTGNPTLKPYRATQADLGAEYYFSDGGLVSATLFYKDIKSFVTTVSSTGTIAGFPGTFFITRPENGPGGSSKGVELGLQQTLGFLSQSLSGFGVVANFTYVDSKRDGSTLPIENTSKYSYNLIGFYEQGPFQARAAYNWRSSQYIGVSRGADLFLTSRGQLDFSVSWEVLKNLTVSLEGQNVLQNSQSGFAAFPERRNLYTIDDRRFFLGARVSF